MSPIKKKRHIHLNTKFSIIQQIINSTLQETIIIEDMTNKYILLFCNKQKNKQTNTQAQVTCELVPLMSCVHLPFFRETTADCKNTI